MQGNTSAVVYWPSATHIQYGTGLKQKGNTDPIL